MTVAELIEQLKTLDPDLPVGIAEYSINGYHWFLPLRGTFVEIGVCGNDDVDFTGTGAGGFVWD